MKIHDKYVIELKEVIRGYGNDPMPHSLLPCDYKFYEIDGVAICEESFKKMTPLNDLVLKALEDVEDEIDKLEDGISSYSNDRPWVYKDEVLEIIEQKMAELKGEQK